ncbi:MAG: hypothetical protein WA902_14960 [Thermosynechococcaceae cyanobacterium]
MYMRAILVGAFPYLDDMQIRSIEQPDGTYVGEALFSGGKRQRTDKAYETTIEAILATAQIFKGTSMGAGVIERLKLLDAEAMLMLLLVYRQIATSEQIERHEERETFSAAELPPVENQDSYGWISGPLNDCRPLDYLENLGYLKSEYKERTSWDRIILTAAGAQIAQERYESLMKVQPDTLIGRL